MRVFFFLKEGIVGLKRARLSAIIAITSLCVALTLIGIFSVAALNLKDTLFQFYREIEIEAFLDPDLSPNQINQLQQQIQAFPEISRVSYISREQALQEFQKVFGENLQAVLKENPLPASFRIVLDPDYSQPQFVEKVASRLNQVNGIQDVLYQKELIQFLHKYLKLGISIGGIIAISLLIIITVLVFNTIRLTIHARRNIIQIMKLVGATNQFIKGPFIYEGILQGLIGGLLSVILLWTIHYAVKYFMFAELVMENYIYGGLVVLGILLGLIGSYLSVNKYLD
jgi:cell division transport system permease protein